LGLEEGAGVEVVDGIPQQVLGVEHILLVQEEVEYIGRGPELCVEEEDVLLVARLKTSSGESDSW